MSRKLWIGLVVVLLLGGAAFVGGKFVLRHRAMKWKEQGLAAADAGDYAKAADLLNRYLSRYGGDTRTLRRYVEVRELAELPRGRHIAETVNALRLLISEDPELPDRRHLLDLYVRLERGPETLDAANAILSLKGFEHDSQTLKLKVETLTRMHREREALATAQEWVDPKKGVPNDFDGQMAYFELRSIVQQPAEQVLDDATKLQQGHANDPRYEVLLGSVYARQGDVPNTRQWLNQAAGRSGVDEPTIKTIIAQFDSLGLAQDSLAVLRGRLKAGAGPELRHLLGQRDWEVGAWAEAADMLADVDPKDLKSEATLVAQRAMALTNLGKKADADFIRSALKARNQAAASVWTLLLRRILDSEPIDDKQVVAACQSALLLDARNPYLNYYLGDANARLGEAELAIEAWQRSVAFNSTWSVPAVRLVEVLLQKGRGDQALTIAMRAQRTGNPAAVIMLAKAAAAYFDRGGTGDREQLDKLITAVQEKIPGEDQTLLVRADLDAQKGQKDAAINTARSIVRRTPAASEQSLLAVASLSRKYQLGIESEALAASEQAHGMTPLLAYVRAIHQFLAGQADTALADFDAAAKRAGKADDRIWRLARARFLDVTNNPAAHDECVKLGDAFPDSIDVQQTIVTARSVSRDRDFMKRTIDRLHALTGETALAWRLAQARLMVDSPQSDRDIETASVDLTNILRANPTLPEAHVLLAHALVHLKRFDGAIDHLNVASKLDPGNVPLALELASLLQSRGEFERVRQALGNINDQFQSSDQRHQAALLLARQGNLDKAIKLLEDAQQQDPTPDLVLASFYSQRRQFDKAEPIVRKLMLMEKPKLEAVQFVAMFYASQGRQADAQAALARLDTLGLAPGEKEATLAGYALQTGNADEAIRRFQDATQQAPTNAKFWRSLAICQIVTGKAADAMATLDEATRVIPGDEGFGAMKRQSALFRAGVADPVLRPVALEILGNLGPSDTSFELLKILVEGRRSLDSEHLAAQLQQFAERHPESLTAQLQLVQAYMDMGRRNDALATAQRAMNTFATDPEPARVAVRVASLAQRWPDMISAAEAWKKRKPEEAPAADMAVIKAQIGGKQYNAVLSQLQPYISDIKADPQKNPEQTEAYAIALLNTGGADDASALLWPLAQKSPEWRLRWRQAAMEATDHDLAGQWLDRVAGITPADAIAEQVLLAEAYDRLAKSSNDSQFAQKASAIYARVAGDPKAGAVSLTAAAFRAQSHGDTNAAEALYRRAIAADPSLFLAKNNLAMLLVEQNGDLKEAEQLAADAVATQPRVAGLHDTLATVQAKARNFKAAAESERQAIELDPDNVTWRVRQASYLLEGGDPVQAANALKALDSARLDARKATPQIQKELESLRTRVRGERAQAAP